MNSFGISGSNFHLILDSAASFGVASSPEKIPNGISPKPDSTTTELLLFSANHAESLKAVSQGYREYAEQHPDRHRDLAYTLAERREHLKIRSFSLVGARGRDAPFEASPQVKPKGTANKVAFVFTGQGAQWAGMGRQLILDYASFRHDIRAMDAALQTLQERPEWSIEGTGRRAPISTPCSLSLPILPKSKSGIMHRWNTDKRAPRQISSSTPGTRP